MSRLYYKLKPNSLPASVHLCHPMPQDQLELVFRNMATIKLSVILTQVLYSTHLPEGLCRDNDFFFKILLFSVLLKIHKHRWSQNNDCH